MRRLEDAGASAIVMRSLFEEQLEGELAAVSSIESHDDSSPEAMTYMPRAAEFVFGPDEYLEHVRRIKDAVELPVIASLNGITAAGWLQHAKLIEQAGADALELNVYYLATDPAEESAAVERRALDIVRAVKAAVRIPVIGSGDVFSASDAREMLDRRKSSRPDIPAIKALGLDAADHAAFDSARHSADHPVVAFQVDRKRLVEPAHRRGRLERPMR